MPATLLDTPLDERDAGICVCGKSVYVTTFNNSREEEQNIRSIGNSLTCYRDLETDEDVYMLLLLLSDSVAARLRESGLGKAKTVHVSVTDNALAVYGKQGKMPFPSKVSVDIADCAFALYKAVYPGILPVRAGRIGERIHGRKRPDEHFYRHYRRKQARAHGRGGR